MIKTWSWLLGAAVIFAGTPVLVPTAGAEPESAPQQKVIGRQIEGFTLSDFRGKSHALADCSEANVVVVAFLGTECPLVKLYAQRLQKMADQYAKQGVVMLGIYSNQQDSLAEMENFARTHAVRFPLLKDPGNRVADQFGAERTPEVFVLDAARVVRYRGRIDDQYTYETQRNRAEMNYLTAAIDQLLAGQPVAIAQTEAVGCQIGRQFTQSEDKGVTYARQISRLLQRRCVECHRPGEIAPFSLTEYAEVAGWAPMIEEVVRQERMPPWHAAPQHGHFSNDRRLSDEEKRLIYQWVADGAPQGDPAEEAEPLTFVPGWQLTRQPDAVFPMRDRPYEVPAEGTIRYRYFTVDPGFEEDKWVTAAEILPGNRQVVHHVLVFAKPPGERRITGEAGGYLAGYVPGLRAQAYPQGMAKLVPAGSQLVFQVHYTPVGTPQQDISRLGLIFADPQEVTHRVITSSARQGRLEIPPHAENHREEATSPTAPVDLLLLSMMPHMHLRGKAFRYEAQYPDGSQEILLDVPRYDFNWQTSYRLAEPKPMPAGTRIHCTAHYDNSEENLANPDPTRTVRWGDQTWDEMMLGYFDVAVPVDTANRERPTRPRPPAGARPASQLFRRLDANRDALLQRDEVPQKYRHLFEKFDQDGGGTVSPDEFAAELARPAG